MSSGQGEDGFGIYSCGWSVEGIAVLRQLSAPTDMKILLLTLSVVCSALAEAPYPPSGTKPEGALLLLPPQYNQPSKAESTSQLSQAEDLVRVSAKVMDRLRQEAGSDTGSYHVYLADGRLQKVQYTTAPLKSGQQENQQDTGFQAYSGSQQSTHYSNQYKQSNNKESSDLNPIIAQFGRLQQEYQQQQIQQLQQRQQQLEQEQQKLRKQQEQLKSANYVASIQYSNVDPINTPVYSYKPSPVTRILRYAPEHF